jgi:glycosyltransferase involved in cell wall biosynthesis
MTLPARALVVTVVHHPEDARIRHRQINALLDTGWEVTYAAPFLAHGVATAPVPGLTLVDLPRAAGRSRLPSLHAARRLLKARGAGHHVVLLHDPELLLATRGLSLPPVVWDVHEDTAAAVSLKPWLPAGLGRPAAWAVRRVERRAERRVNLLLAEDAYQYRFRRPHPVVPNTTRVPSSPVPPDDPRVVYVGHLTRARGAFELIELARILHRRTQGRLTVELVGHADASTAAALTAASEVVTWRGFLPHDEAMARVDGALAGLSLLHDEANYRVSRPTKVVEYLAHGVPVVTTPLPLAKRLVEEVGAGVVVPFVGVTAAGVRRADPRQVADAVLSLDADPRTRLRMGTLGHAYARDQFDWALRSREFVSRMGAIALAPRP